jgi:hypothetical protein
MGQSLIQRSPIECVCVSECDHEISTGWKSRAVEPWGKKSFKKSQCHILLKTHLCKICVINI